MADNPTPGGLVERLSRRALMHGDYNGPLLNPDGPEAAAEITSLRAEIERLNKLYQELIFQVGIKHPGETRHETALRYLRNAEVGGDNIARTTLQGTSHAQHD